MGQDILWGLDFGEVLALVVLFLVIAALVKVVLTRPGNSTDPN